jgi:hypothetical protein
MNVVGCHYLGVRCAWPAVLSLSMLSAGAFAQPAEKLYDGAWTARLTAPDGAVQSATLELKAYDGTWQDRPGSRRAAKAACGGKKIPISVQASTPTLLLFTVWGEVVGPGCATLTVMARPRGETELGGPVDQGAHASESPEVHASHSGQTAASAAPSNPSGSAGSVRLTLRR